VIIDLVALPANPAGGWESLPNIDALRKKGVAGKMIPVFPSVTCPAQATLWTGALPKKHGIIANGLYRRKERRVEMWEQPADLVETEQAWRTLAKSIPGFKTALLFGQHTLYGGEYIVVTPRPQHRATGLVPWCYSTPPGLYEEIAQDLGHFPLHHYWGPAAGLPSSRWIAEAAVRIVTQHRPDLTFVYLPHLDYDAQRFGPDSVEAHRALGEIDDLVGRIVEGIAEAGLAEETSFMLLSEYHFHSVSGAIPVNLILRDAGLLTVREVAGEEIIDPGLSKAIALTDHQFAHVYVTEDDVLEEVRSVLLEARGVAQVLDRDGQADIGTDHPNAGDLLVLAKPDRYCYYGWWREPELVPYFAKGVDIHQKPGYDPLELFSGQYRGNIAWQDPTLVKGSHGLPPASAEDAVALIASGAAWPDAPFGDDDTVDATDIAGMILDFFGISRKGIGTPADRHNSNR